MDGSPSGDRTPYQEARPKASQRISSRRSSQRKRGGGIFARIFFSVARWVASIKASYYARHYFKHNPEPLLPPDDPDFSKATAQYEAMVAARAREEEPPEPDGGAYVPLPWYDPYPPRRRRAYDNDHCWDYGGGDRPDGGGPSGGPY